MKRFVFVLIAIMLVLALGVCTFAAEESAPEVASENVETSSETDNASVTGTKALAAALVVGIVAAAGAIGMAIAIGKSVESMARQPENSGKINSAMMLGLVFIETAIIYALIVAILVIFVL